MTHAVPDRDHAGPAGLPAPPRRDALLGPYLLAVCLTALTTWTVYVSAQRSVAYDLTGHVESLLPLARLGVLTAPLMVAFRAGAAAFIVWLVAGAMNERLTLRAAAAAVVLWMPVLDVPALLDALVVFLSPQRSWADAHVALGLELLVSDASGRIRVLAQSLNVALVAWMGLVAYRLRPRLARGLTVAIPAVTAAATLLVVLPLLRR